MSGKRKLTVHLELALLRRQAKKHVKKSIYFYPVLNRYSNFSLTFLPPDSPNFHLRSGINFTDTGLRVLGPSYSSYSGSGDEPLDNLNLWLQKRLSFTSSSSLEYTSDHAQVSANLYHFALNTFKISPFTKINTS